MTLDELKEKVFKIQFQSSGCYKIWIEYKEKYYSCLTNNTLATNRIKYGSEYPKVEEYGYTLKQAFQALYDECKRKNNLFHL